MKTVLIHIEGQVQGVGFRPFVFNLAQRFQLKGEIRNSMNGVDLIMSGTADDIADFYRSLIQNPPEKAVILKHHSKALAYRAFTALKIKASHQKNQPNVVITPDISLCAACTEELQNEHDRRYAYAFTSCEQCGPRYSILEKLPFDRANTSMHDFELCPQCQNEYDAPDDRRFYAQTNSCHDCGVELSLWEHGAELDITDLQQVYSKIIQALENKQVVAVKGIGGYLLLADATSSAAIKTLRKRKHRPSKPFALLYHDLEQLNKDVITNDKAVTTWLSDAAPIVLFRLKANPRNPIEPELIAPGLNQLGIMPPNAPILEIISRLFKKPLIATSGNDIHSFIAYTEEMAKEQLKDIADLIVMNDRRIILPQDDSVVGFSPVYQHKIVYRRSRGYAPGGEGFHLPQDQSNILCMGALLKSTFAIQCRNNIFLSQYLGNTQYMDQQDAYQRVLDHLMDLLQFKPHQIVVDMHPEYYSSQLGKRLAETYGVSIKPVQHHKAHFAAVLAEHDWMYPDDPVLGVVWDGTGYGDDGHIWGGEFFLCQEGEMTRVDHFSYYDQLLGDKMVKEPRLSALSLTKAVPEAKHHLRPYFTDNEWALYHKYLSLGTGLQTSSVGRLFDAVAFLLGLTDQPTYEGESAIRLQMLAEQYTQRQEEEISAYPLESPNSSNLIQYIIQDLDHGLAVDAIAVKFHLTLVHIIGLIAEQNACHKIAFSGGVFQNSFLLDLIIEKLGHQYDIRFHEQLSPNDENIALGQLAFVLMEQCKKKAPLFSHLIKR